ncbi:MAG: stage III sporulation protein E [Firmicutes bacterium GWE2_51_13]|nr:MAG: stage III sporulation protein E [Firmicutes bacterium GWE2_51_13]
MARRKTLRKEERKLLYIINALILFTLTIISFQRFGIVGIYLDRLVRFFVGETIVFFYVLMFLYALFILFWRKNPNLRLKTSIALGLMLTAVILTASYRAYTRSDIGFAVFEEWMSNTPEIFTEALSPNGGLVGVFLYSLFTLLFARTGTLIVIVFLYIVAILLFVDWKYVKKAIAKMRSAKNRVMTQIGEEMAYEEKTEPELPKKKHRLKFLTPDVKEPEVQEVVVPEKRSTVIAKPSLFDEREVTTKSAATIHNIGNYVLPDIKILDEVAAKSKSSANANAAVFKGKKLLEILSNFGINATLVATHIGPAVTKFEVRPDSNVKVSKIASIQDNIKMELAAKDIRIEAPIPGRNAVGVEIPNVEMIPVRMAEMLKEIPPEKMNKKLLFALGRDLSGRPIFSELDKMPHLLIAGATGSGKSVCVNSIISTLLLRTTPDEVKMILIDPKKVEFTSFQKIPHLICPVISDASEAARALKIVVKMMENRYEVFSKCNVRNITAYNELLIKAPQEHLEPMPWIVVIIDELADLMIVAGKEVESSIQRITQLARAAGIHLIVATQRPSVDVITGIIKSNIPSRIAFAVSSGVDSRTILDHVGAERLLGYGDMLFIPVGEPASVRIQGVFVSDDEVRRLAETTAAQRKPTYDEAFINPEDGEGLSEGIASALDDPLFDEVKEYVIETQRASTSSIQRRFGLGYNRAARMMDVLEQKGIIGPTQGSKPRDVRVRKTDDED